MMLPEKIKQRNEWLEQFFRKIFPDKIILANTFDNPAVVYNQYWCLSCFVHNHELKFMDAPRDGRHVYSVVLSENISYDAEKIFDWYKNSEHRKIYKLLLKDTKPELFLCGYNFKNKSAQSGRYPVFSPAPKIYMSYENANAVMEEIKKEGFEMILL